MELIPFNRPYLTGNEINYIANAHKRGALAGDGFYTNQCHQLIEKQTGTPRALLTHSCTAALEMAGMLANLSAGDEVIMPSFTFVSTANAVVRQGAVPVFIDIRSDTLNLDQGLIEQAITKRTKAILPVHYAGVGCDMDEILEIGRHHNLMVIEDAAQGVHAKYRGKPLGSIGDLGAFSYHETKNIISGEGGCLLVNDENLIQRAEIIREKGTDRSLFFRGQVDKYTWQDVGSSYLPGELVAAFLFAQLEATTQICDARITLWNRYHSTFEALEQQERLRRPIIPDYCEHNGHMYYLLLPDPEQRAPFIEFLKSRNIHPVFHYVPLHSAPAGIKYGRVSGSMELTDSLASRLVRLPLWIGLEHHQQRVIDAVFDALV